MCWWCVELLVQRFHVFLSLRTPERHQVCQWILLFRYRGFVVVWIYHISLNWERLDSLRERNTCCHVMCRSLMQVHTHVYQSIFVNESLQFLCLSLLWVRRSNWACKVSTCCKNHFCFWLWTEEIASRLRHRCPLPSLTVEAHACFWYRRIVASFPRDSARLIGISSWKLSVWFLFCLVACAQWQLNVCLRSERWPVVACSWPRAVIAWEVAHLTDLLRSWGSVLHREILECGKLHTAMTYLLL